jgi:hypothetical protein
VKYVWGRNKGRFCNIIRNVTLKISGNGFSFLCFISALELYFSFCIICGVIKEGKNANSKECLPSVLMHDGKGIERKKQWTSGSAVS